MSAPREMTVADLPFVRSEIEDLLEMATWLRTRDVRLLERLRRRLVDGPGWLESGQIAWLHELWDRECSPPRTVTPRRRAAR